MTPTKKAAAVQRVWVRVAVNMARVYRGQYLLVDPEDEDMAAKIESGALVPEERPS